MTRIKDIKIAPYDPNWPKLFESVSIDIKNALGDNCIAIHHVGSTSVPSLASKPKLDVIAEVKSLMFNHEALEKIDYTYKGGFNLPLRKSFTHRTEPIHINLHIFETGDPEIKLNLIFRDHLRNSDEARDNYAKLKYDLVKKEESHKKNDSIYTGYTLGKNAFIQNILEKAGFVDNRFVFCTHYDELESAKYFRRKYFFNKTDLKDPYEWTFNHPDHKHFMLYKGTRIVGYAHIQLWQESRVALGMIVIDEPYRNNGFGAKFLSLCEKWLRNEGYKTIHTESYLDTLSFYRKHGYIEMPFNDPDGYESSPNDTPLGKML